MFLIACALLVCCGSASCRDINQKRDELVFAQIIFRHGDRTVRFTYPNDPYNGKEHWPEGIAQLTNQGKQQQYELGKFLRRRYRQLLGNYTNPSDKVYAVSSELDRTINSAALVLAGLFPPKNEQIWNTHLLWQPIPVHILPKKKDYFIATDRVCDRLEQAIKEFEKSPKIRALYDKNQDLFQYLEKYAGTPIRGVIHLKDLHGILDVEHLKNKTLPEWTQSVFTPDGEMQHIAEYFMKFTTETTEMKRLKSGFLLREILDRFQNKSQSILQPDRSIWLYSGHDSTIGPILNSLGLFEDVHIPPYASSVHFEMYESSGNFYLQIFYRNTTAEDMQPLNIPNCGPKCDLNRFYDLYRDILPTSDAETECKLSN